VNSLPIVSPQASTTPTTTAATAMIVESSNNMNATQEALSTAATVGIDDANAIDLNDVNNSPMSSQQQQQEQQQKIEQEAMETTNEKFNSINSTTTHNSAISMPIPIPSRTTINTAAAAAANNQIDPTAMSVPNDVLLSSSLLSTSTSPLGATPIGDNSLSGVSIGGSDKKKRNRCCVESCKRKVGLTGALRPSSSFLFFYFIYLFIILVLV
jgi:hypothetical protein